MAAHSGLVLFREPARQTPELLAVSKQTILDPVVELQHAYFCIKQGDVAGAARWAEKRGLATSGAILQRDAKRDLADTRLLK